MKKPHLTRVATPKAEENSEELLRVYNEALLKVLKEEIEEGINSRSKRTLLIEIGFPLKYGQILHIVGSIEAIGNWDVSKSLSLNWTPSHIWKNNITVSARDGYVEYKYIIKTDGLYDIIWEPGPNHKVNVNVENEVIYVNDVWGVTNIIEPSRITV